jgi:hypothetical protein
MDLTKLKWTKNVNHPERYWAYSYEDINFNSKVFYLHWTEDSRSNAKVPQEEDLIIIRQRTNITHIVEVLNNTVYSESENLPSRLVRAVWIAEYWKEPPEEESIFGYTLNYPSGKVINLKESHRFNEYWNNKGGLSAFQELVQKTLKL